MTFGTGGPERRGPILGSVSDSQTSSRALTWIALATCWVTDFPIWLEMAQRPGLLLVPRNAVWLAGFLLFLGAFVVVVFKPMGRAVPLCRVLLVVQSVIAVGLCWLIPNSLGGVKLVLIAAELASLVPSGPALAWIAAQTLAFAIPLVTSNGIVGGPLVAGAYAGFELFAFYTFRMADSERQARAELARTHESLLAARQLLAESTRAAERLRIARELHDVLGHHLTALSLNLEAALHAPEDKSREHMVTAQRLAKGLLEEVREVVSTLRQDEEVPPSDSAPALEGRLAAALAELRTGVDGPLVHLTVRPDVRLGSPELAHTVLRWTQEVFTNAVRHAGARNLWLEVSDGGGGLNLRACDDGRGAAEIVPGNGLQGMRERLERLGGRLDVASAPGRGFEVTAWIPAAAEGAA